MARINQLIETLCFEVVKLYKYYTMRVFTLSEEQFWQKVELEMEGLCRVFLDHIFFVTSAVD